MAWPKAVAVALSVLTLSLAGCITPNSAPGDDSNSVPGTVSLPTPRAGSAYHYRGSDGSELNVTIVGLQHRLNRALDAQPVVVLNWTLTTADRSSRAPSPTTYRFQEMVEPASGRIVQQVAVCGTRWDEPELAGSTRACYDERAMVGFAAAGLLGAFGAGPFWNRSFDSGRDVTVPAYPLGGGKATYRYTTEQVQFGDRSCVELDGTHAPTAVATGLPWTVTDGPVTFCSGLALPVRFPAQFDETPDRTYRLVDHTPGAYRIDLTEGGSPPPRDGPLAMREVSGSFLVDDPTDRGRQNFSVREAHRVALNRSDEYEHVWTQAASPIVSGTLFMNRSAMSSFQPGGETVYEDVDHTRCVEIQDPANRQMAEVCIKKDDADRMWETSQYEVNREESGRVQMAVNRSRLPNQQATLGSGLRLAEDIHPLTAMWWGEVYKVSEVPWSPQSDKDDIWRSDGYSLAAFFDDPTPEGEPSVQLAYQYHFDGPTGTVQWLYLNRTRLPLKSQV